MTTCSGVLSLAIQQISFSCAAVSTIFSSSINYASDNKIPNLVGTWVGINKTICSSIKMDFNNNEIEKISFYISPDGKLKPENLVDENLRELDGFIWRINEKPNTINDLFKK